MSLYSRLKGTKNETAQEEEEQIKSPGKFTLTKFTHCLVVKGILRMLCEGRTDSQEQDVMYMNRYRDNKGNIKTKEELIPLMLLAGTGWSVRS